MKETLTDYMANREPFQCTLDPVIRRPIICSTGDMQIQCHF